MSQIRFDQRVLPIRPLDSGDGEALKRFNRELSVESRRRFLPHGYDDQTITRVLKRSEEKDDLVLGAFDGERLVAYFFLWNFRERVPLLGIGMLDDYQHKGLGKQVMAYLIQQARLADREGIELTTMLDNDAAFALYLKMGFVYLGDVENIQGDGQMVIERGMFLALKPGARPMDGPHRPPV